MSDEVTYGTTQSVLTGKPTQFKGATFHGAKFEDVKNTTNARLPGSSELKAISTNEGLVSKLFSMFKK